MNRYSWILYWLLYQRKSLGFSFKQGIIKTSYVVKWCALYFVIRILLIDLSLENSFDNCFASLRKNQMNFLNLDLSKVF